MREAGMNYAGSGSEWYGKWKAGMNGVGAVKERRGV